MLHMNGAFYSGCSHSLRVALYLWPTVAVEDDEAFTYAQTMPIHYIIANC